MLGIRMRDRQRKGVRGGLGVGKAPAFAMHLRHSNFAVAAAAAVALLFPFLLAFFTFAYPVTRTAGHASWQTPSEISVSSPYGAIDDP